MHGWTLDDVRGLAVEDYEALLEWLHEQQKRD